MYCWARYLFIVLATVLALGQMIAACGQKGDLYLPEPEKSAPSEQPKGADVPAAPVQTREPGDGGEGSAAKTDTPSQRGE